MTARFDATGSIESTYKAREVEGFLDLHFYRKIGFQLALLFSKLGVTPAQVTSCGPLLGIAAGASSSVQMAVADYLRNAYMYFGSDRSRGEFDSSARLEEEYAQLKWRNQPWRKVLLRVYLDYTVGQERYIPQMMKVRN